MEEENGIDAMANELRIFLIFALSVMLIVCVLGNSLILVALPYVRDKYKAQFSALQSATFLLLLHLSFADILYGVLGYPHFIHSLVVGGENPFQFPGGDNLCWTLGMLRNWVAEADFTTMGAIAFMACRQMVCKKCEEKKDFSNHQEHDGMYSRRGVMVVILLVWVWSLAFILPDCVRLTGGYRWSNTTYGCDNVYYEEGEKSYGIIINTYLTILVIFISYSIVAWKLRKGRRENEENSSPGSLDMSGDNSSPGSLDMSGDNSSPGSLDKSGENSSPGSLDMSGENSSENTTQNNKMLLRLAITYTICVLPASFFCWEIFEIEWFPEDNQLYKQVFQASLNCLYWSMYCINFLLYLVPNSEIRRGFIMFFRDVKGRCSASLKRGIDKIKINRSLSPKAPDMPWDNSSTGSLDKKENQKSLLKTRKVTLVSSDSDIIYICTRL